jgi:hypothetical protein
MDMEEVVEELIAWHRSRTRSRPSPIGTSANVPLGMSFVILFFMTSTNNLFSSSSRIHYPLDVSKHINCRLDELQLPFRRQCKGSSRVSIPLCLILVFFQLMIFLFSLHTCTTVPGP